MCLDKMTRISIKNRKGYKVFKKLINKKLCKVKDKLYLCNWNISFQIERKIKPLSIGKWLNEKNYRVSKNEILYTNDTNKYYPLGFHVFSKIKGARDLYNDDKGYNTNDFIYEIYELEFKNVVAQGIQGGHSVIVAKDIKIIRKI